MEQYNELPKAFDPQEVEQSIYQSWEESGYFNPDNLPGDRIEQFSIMMPPPNVTGVLHLGHALENSLMDIQVRYQRLRGKKALLVPGVDHAAVATQAKVEKNLIDSGNYTNPREELGREKLLEKIRAYADKSRDTILSQVRTMGTSCDWSRFAYTFDEERSKAVNTVFEKMYNDGLIYKGYRVVNWTTKGQSTCSDDELEYIERQSKMYTFKYSKDFPITIASTRPETKLGDTAVAVHPDDIRYQQYIGQTFTVDVGAEKPLEIKIIADEGVDMELGTGALGVTPAHSQVDFEMYEKRLATDNEIGLIQVIGEDGTMTKAAGRAYEGLTVDEAREKFSQYLRDNGLMENEEEITQNVSVSDRYKDIIEVLPKEQWFVAVNKEIPGKGKTLKDLMREAVTTGHNGNAEQKVTINPDRFEKIYLHWIDNLRDWCISRQIWWGHRIPAWHKQENSKSQNTNDKEIHVGTKSPGEGWIQDEDTLDTWFSSGMWTFSTLGYPEETTDLKTFHPTSWMQMGHEILFFWMARMILMSTYTLDEIPFKDVYIHGMLRDKDGRKFSKSLGNGVDPIDVSKQYGTDALRLSLIVGIAPGADARFSDERVKHYKSFINKVWNMSRFLMMNIPEQATYQEPQPQSTADKWVMSRLHRTIQDMTDHLDNYRFSQAAECIYEFAWHDFADWYIETAKRSSFAKATEDKEEDKDGMLIATLINILTLLHPYAPFVTEYIWGMLSERVSGLPALEQPLMIAQWPAVNDTYISEEVEKEFEAFKEVVTTIRNHKAAEGIKMTEPIEMNTSVAEKLSEELRDLAEKMIHVSFTESGKNIV